MEVQERRRKVAVLYLHRVRQIDIARQLHVAQATVSRDLKALEKQWLRESTEMLAQVKAREVAELDEMEEEAARRYQEQKSLKWFKARLALKEQRAKLLGLNAATSVDVTSAGEPLSTDSIVVWEVVEGDEPERKERAATAERVEVSPAPAD